MEDFHNIIKKTISEFGNNIITEVRFVNILSDYGAFESFPAYKFVIKELINAGFMGKLLNEVAASKNDNRDGSSIRHDGGGTEYREFGN